MIIGDNLADGAGRNKGAPPARKRRAPGSIAARGRGGRIRGSADLDLRLGAEPLDPFVVPFAEPDLRHDVGELVPDLVERVQADFVGQLSDEAIAIHARYAEKRPTILSAMHLYPVDGAAGRVGPSETAWSYREAKWGQVIVGVDPDPNKRDAITRWAKDYWGELHPHSLGGAYVNMMMDEGEDRIRGTYGENHGRLAALKRKYDPTNLFRLNQNISPSA